MLEVIYVTRHGFRSNWLVDPASGTYTAAIRSPTGGPADPALTAHGVDQARELAGRLAAADPPIRRVYSSLYYRCLQTVEPFVRTAGQAAVVTKEITSAEDGSQSYNDGTKLTTAAAAAPETTGETGSDKAAAAFFGLKIRGETGLGEWYGSASFEHPTPAARSKLDALFPALLDPDYRPALVPTRTGESIAELHDRVAATMDALVANCDREGVRAVLLCSHAAVVIALGRVLTGAMPDCVEAEDFRAFTCGLSVYRRKTTKGRRQSSRSNSGDGALAGHAVEIIGPSSSQVGGNIGQSKAQPAAVAASAGSWRGGCVDSRDIDRSESRNNSGGPTTAGVRNSADLKIPSGLRWRDGRGVRGGWDCELNSDCSHLSGGEERGWRFSGDESFKDAGKSILDAGMELGVVVEGGKGEDSKRNNDGGGVSGGRGSRKDPGGSRL
ncbi:histidine phosphatase superfamily [Lasiosphaeria miniovina]|uniref:Histidine phosphatase superfamily n=1 Tax=Lasiosphaeria miniovina TaxID=1954250 RepID=A0AA40AVD3_9PEZI|nr:histidine phosphatase superfamily [Lasiosphaeria miniovina]KAK0722730.1 histidine phosphatase superfamily [Lasiosphaeria miniovina]